MIRIPEVTAQDLMVTDVLELQASARIRDAVEAFDDYHIHGAPVVDEAGRLVGVLTAADIVKCELIPDGGPGGDDDDSDAGDESDEGVEATSFSHEGSPGEALDQDTVGDWMTRDVIAVSPGESLQKICATMANEQIHRVFVVDGEKLVGVVSAIDVVRHIAEKSRR